MVILLCCLKETYMFGTHFIRKKQFENSEHENVGIFCNPIIMIEKIHILLIKMNFISYEDEFM